MENIMSNLTVPVDTLVPISQFGRGTASAQFTKVANGRPVTVLKNNEPMYFILNLHDYQRLNEMEEENKQLRDQLARQQVTNKEYTHSFDDPSQLEDYFDAL